MNIKVIFRQDEDTKWWTTTVPSEPAVVSQGRTLEDAYRKVRLAIGLVRDDADALRIIGHTEWDHRKDLPDSTVSEIKRSCDLRLRVLQLNEELGMATADAVHELVIQQHRTYRATGLLLGISHQRVEQIVGEYDLFERK